MTTLSSVPGRRRTVTFARASGSTGDTALVTLCVLAGLLAAATLVALVYEIVSGAGLAFNRFGFGFLGHQTWAPNFFRFGAAVALYGTAVTSIIALVIAVPLGVAIALYLSLLSPRAVRVVVGPLIEMLAAVPSVIVGFFGLIFIEPFLPRHIESPLHAVLGWTGVFGAPQTTGLGLFLSGLVLAFMILPIIASLSRDIFLTVPRELRDGAEALGATQWEVIRGVVLPGTVSGVASATLLGLGRALGEAIAVTEVIGAGNAIHANVFRNGFTFASRIANDIQYPTGPLQVSALYYMATLLLIIGAMTILAGRAIGRRYDVTRQVRA